MQMFTAELVGTLILVTLGDGVVANAVLNRSKGQNGGWLMISAGWGLAVAMAVYCVGRISGAHLNPAVTLGLLAIGEIDVNMATVYLIAQICGAVLGACLVWLAYLPHWQAGNAPNEKLGIFCTAPAIRSTGANICAEIIGTAMLMFGILAIGDNSRELTSGPNIDLANAYSTGFTPLLVGFLVASIGMSLGGPTGYAINPARDLGPRIAHTLLPIPAKGDSDWGYAWVPVLGPIIGGVFGALLYQSLGF